MKKAHDTDDPIMALATPWGESALAIIRTAGPGTIELVSACLERPEKIKKAPHGSMLYGVFVHPDTHNPIDQVTMAVYRAPHGYTGQDSVEIFCHGSLPGISAIIEALRAAGFYQADPGEFTLRAFLNGKMDLTQAEAVQEIVASKSRKSQALAFERLSGGLFRRIDKIKEQLVSVLSVCEVQLDYAEDEIGGDTTFPEYLVLEARKNLRQLLSTYAAGRIYRDGAKVVLAGRTNAGKSSLFNLFLKEDRSIVSEIHGTTRDYIESWITIGGIPVRLYDTAGFRVMGKALKTEETLSQELSVNSRQMPSSEKVFTDTADVIEEEGIRRSSAILEQADVILYLVDASLAVPETESPDALTLEIEAIQKKAHCVVVYNKCDIADMPVPEGAFSLSTITGEGFTELEKHIVNLLRGTNTRQQADEEVMIDSLRQKELLERAEEALNSALDLVDEGVPLDLITVEIQEAVQALGELTGEVTAEDVLDKIFSGFCVGK